MLQVLVVDKDPPIIQLLKVNLERAGYAVAGVSNNPDALTRLAQEPPVDFAIIEVMLRGMDGLELIGAIRAQPAYADLPIVATGGLRNDIPDAMERMRAFFAERFGPCSYMVKPFNPAEMVRLVGPMLEPPA